LTPELAMRLGRAAGLLLRERRLLGRVVIGRDTRKSGPMLGAALASGLCSAGVDVVSLGIVPTPTVSYAARTGGFALGAVVSASHNPAPDNGIKFFGSDGRKLSDADEAELERLMDEPISYRPEGAAVGSLSQDRLLEEAYFEYLVAFAPEGLAGMKIALDAANGAASWIGPRLFERLGATVTATGCEPDGLNINAEGGATRPEFIERWTVESGADVGVAFDGDADRAVFSDEKGRLLNGDRVMGAWCAQRMRTGSLEPPVAVGTVMTNGGLEHFLGTIGVRLERAPVGDKYVAQLMADTDARIGGEQSGHIIFPERGPTGDGLMTALEFFRVLRSSGEPASSVFDAYVPWPQVLINVAVGSKTGWDQGRRVSDALEGAKAMLDGQGRLSVRPSGTQPMIRVMVEARDMKLRDQVAELVLEAMRAELQAEARDRVDLTYGLGD
jgi:phosphoglucosamine mutase